MATRKIADLTQATTASDADLMVIQDTSKTKKITFSTLLTSIKSKLGVGTAANLNTTSKEIVGAINEINTNFTNSTKTYELQNSVTGLVYHIAVGRMRILSYDLNFPDGYKPNESYLFMHITEKPLCNIYSDAFKGYSNVRGEPCRIHLNCNNQFLYAYMPTTTGSVKGTIIYLV